MKKILIFGHKNPDTDSVCASISMSYLKNKMGLNTEPRVLGDINDETKYVLDTLNIKCPRYLNDVKLQIKDVRYRKKYYINYNESIFKAFNYMNDKDISTIPVVDNNNKFFKSLAMKDIARMQILGNNNIIYTAYDHIIETLNGDAIVKIDHEINGNIISIKEDIVLKNNDIIITDNKYITEYCIKKKVHLIVMTNNIMINNRYIKLASKNKVNIIKTSLDSLNTNIKISLSNYIKEIPFTKDLLCINDNDYVSDILDLTKKTKYSYYPIIDKHNTCLGLLKLADLNDKIPKKVILVDHNEYNQSVDGIEEADILEIVDHHRIGTIGTTNPINFRNMPVGSTNTIIYNMFLESNIKIEENIAKVMLAGILSDTLVLSSPTTTTDDIKAVNSLSKIANINYKEFGMEMLKKGTNIEGKNIRDLIYQDFKMYEENHYKIGIGITQVFDKDLNSILDKKDEIIDILNEIASHENYDILSLFVTDIINDISYMIYSDKSKDKLSLCFGKNIYQAYPLKGYISRKKQIVPKIINMLTNK